MCYHNKICFNEVRKRYKLTFSLIVMSVSRVANYDYVIDIDYDYVIDINIEEIGGNVLYDTLVWQLLFVMSGLHICLFVCFYH